MSYIPEPMRQELYQQAEYRCEYCRLPQTFAYHTHEIDHIYAEKHGGQTVFENLCVACADCNRHKGSNLCSLDSKTGEVVTLYHPRRQGWQEHFYLNQEGFIGTLTPNARVTAHVLRFNRLELAIDRAKLIKLGKY